MIKYTSFNDYCLKKFGGKVYKLSLSCSSTCPNRDGKLSFGGCIFCAEGSGSFTPSCEIPIAEQLRLAKERVAPKAKNAVGFIAYFQSFTSTYAPKEVLKEYLFAAAEDPTVLGISVGTRADCLDGEILEILRDINKIKPLTVELGLQTAHEKTAVLIRRHCPLSEFRTATEKLKAAGIEVVFHLILGLPGESAEMMVQSVKTAVALGADGLKLQLLHVLKGTRLAEMWQAGEFKTLELEEYIEILSACLKEVPRRVVIHRLTGDGDKRLLLAPLWSADKKRVLNAIRKRLGEED